MSQQPPDDIHAWSAIWESLKDLPGPIIAGVFGIGAAILGYFGATRQAKTTKEVSVGDHAIRLMAAQTQQFESLVDGYKTRVDDLTKEVLYLRRRVEDLLRTIEHRLDECVGCEHAPRLLKVLMNDPDPDDPSKSH